MENFDVAIGVILKHEGGYVNHPNDNGGPTNYGLSLRFLVDYPELADFNGDGKVDIQDIKIMTREQAEQIYYELWWRKYRYDQFDDLTIAIKAFDFAINMGANRAHRLLQQAVNDAFNTNLVADGIIGPATVRAINSRSSKDDRQRLINAYSDRAWSFYQSIARNNPSQNVFLKGWKNRAYSINRVDQYA